MRKARNKLGWGMDTGMIAGMDKHERPRARGRTQASWTIDPRSTIAPRRLMKEPENQAVLMFAAASMMSRILSSRIMPMSISCFF